MSGFTATALNADEQRLVHWTAAGEIADFSRASAKPHINAALIRHLLLDNPLAGTAGPNPIQWPGVRIRGACIDGQLDLSDCARPGTGLHALMLEDCELAEPIDLHTARLARLSLAGSRVTFVNLRESDIDGPFDFARLRGFGSSDCWIDARGALFGGEVTGGQAKLRAPAGRGLVAGGDRRAALWLAGATIRGNVRLTDGFEAIGSVSLDSANVSGDVVLANAVVVAGEGDAFRAQNANVGGVMLLHYFEAEGVIWLHGLRTGGNLQISNAAIKGEHPVAHGTRHARHEERMAVIVADAEIGASMRLAPELVVDGLISFAVTKIRGQVEASGIRLANSSQDGRARALNGTNADIGASFLLDDAHIEGRIDIAGARIGGRLSFIGASLCNRTPDSLGKAVEAGNITVGADVEFGHSRYDRTRSGPDAGGFGAHVVGTLDLTGAKIGGNLAFIATSFSNPPPSQPVSTELQIGYALAGLIDAPPPRRPDMHRFLPNSMGIALIARQVQVQASVLMTGGFSSDGALLLTGGTIGRDLICHHATLHNPRRSALYAKDIEIGDDLKLIGMTAIGDLRFERASINGSVTWENLSLRATRESVLLTAEPEAATLHDVSSHGRRLRRLWWRARRVRQILCANVRDLCAWSTRCYRTWHESKPDETPLEWPHIPRVDFSHARIGTSLKCAHLLHEAPSCIDLTGLRVTTLDLTHVHGWGRTEGPERHYPIAFDLLVYDRLIFPLRPTEHRPYAELREAVGIPTKHWSWAGPRQNRLADRLLDWLLRDVGNLAVRSQGDEILVEPIKPAERQFFHPQPYRQLARVLLAQGYESEARYIAIAEQWATPRRCMSRFWHSIYGACFGFGLSPTRALITLGSYVLVGTVLAAAALHGDMMVETPLIATATYSTTMTQPTDRAYRAFVSADRKQTRAELSCRDLNPYDSLVYAVDTVLPFIPLHEETKCEFDPDRHLLRFLRAAYTLIGWIITSLALITVSGILKRFDRDAG